MWLVSGRAPSELTGAVAAVNAAQLSDPGAAEGQAEDEDDEDDPDVRATKGKSMTRRAHGKEINARDQGVRKRDIHANHVSCYLILGRHAAPSLLFSL